MNFEKLKAQQAAFQLHLSAQEHLAVVWRTFQDDWPAFTNAIIQAFARHGLQADVSGDLPHPTVKVPPSQQSVFITVGHELRFDESRHQSSYYGVLSVPPKTPIALQLEIRTASTLHISRMWWHGPSDNERVASIVVEMFKGKRGPTEIGSRSCFVATVVFGERSEEVAIFAKVARRASVRIDDWSNDRQSVLSTGAFLCSCCAKECRRQAPNTIGAACRLSPVGPSHLKERGLTNRWTGARVACFST